LGLEDTGLEDTGLEDTGLEDTGLEGTALESAQSAVRRLTRALSDLGIWPQPVAAGNWVGLDPSCGQVTFQAVSVADAARLASLLEDLAGTAGTASSSRQFFPDCDYEPEPSEYLAQRDVFTPVAAPIDPPYPASQHHPRVHS
jgi:hypothetical protein